MESEGATILYSGGRLHERGVGIILGKEAARTKLSWEPISDRIITARIQTRFTKATIVEVYAPTNTAEDEERERTTTGVLDEIPGHDMKILMGDFNAQIGADRSGWEEVMGGMAKGERSDNGERLLDLCNSHKLKIGGSFF